MQGFSITPFLSHQVAGALKKLNTLRAGKCPHCGTAYISLPTITTVMCSGCGILIKPKECKTVNEVLEAIGMPLQ